MFFLPLPLYKTEDTLEEVQMKIDLPDPELFIIVNSKSKVSKMIWQSLINVDVLKSALRKLKSINWLYADVNENSLDDASRHSRVILVVKCWKK